jgi:hypothetical protein
MDWLLKILDSHMPTNKLTLQSKVHEKQIVARLLRKFFAELRKGYEKLYHTPKCTREHQVN